MMVNALYASYICPNKFPYCLKYLFYNKTTTVPVKKLTTRPIKTVVHIPKVAMYI